MHDKRYVWFILFVGICIVNCRRHSYAQHNNANLIDFVKNQKNVMLSENYANLNTKRSSDQQKNSNTQKETYSEETSFKEVAKSRDSQDERKKKKKEDMFTRLLPMFIIPYLVQSAMLPMMLVSLKLMLIKSFLIGKLAVILGIFNMLRARNNSENQEMVNYGSTGSSGGYGQYGMHERETEQMSTKDLLKQHYGYNGNEEFGAWIHHRSYKN